MLVWRCKWCETGCNYTRKCHVIKLIIRRLYLNVQEFLLYESPNKQTICQTWNTEDVGIWKKGQINHLNYLKLTTFYTYSFKLHSRASEPCINVRAPMSFALLHRATDEYKSQT